MRKLLTQVGLTCLIAAVFTLEGFVFSHLWGWFAVPLGAVAIGTAHGVGLSAMVQLVTYQLPSDPKPYTDTQRVTRLGVRSIVAIVTLAIGWVAGALA